MAVLKDLIVHGPSRFLNGIYSNSVHSDLIDVNSGVFKTITTTTLDAGTITTDMLKANNARVAQTLTVDGTISTNKWEAASIANIGGNFYISPTGKSDSGTITVTKTGSTTINGVSVGVYTLVVAGTFGVTSTNDTIWGNNSKVIFTGSISYNDSKKFPLGSCSGTMTTKTTGTNTLTGFTITGVNSSALDIFFKEVGITSISSTACNGYEMQISVYQSYSNSNLRPVGILLTSYGKEKKQYIDIYGGTNVLGDADSGFADPEVRIGQLDGLPNIVDGSTSTDTKPTGWGIYTTNGFFKGKIVANAGRIGNWVIENGSSTYGGAIYTGSFGSDNGIFITPSYTSSTAIGGSSGSQNWTMTASNKFGVTKTGYLYASKGKIAGWTIDTNDLSTGTAGSQSGIKFSNSTFTATINGASRSNLMMSIGSKFGVDRDGTLYANGANITNINANNISSNLLTAMQAVVSNLSVLRADMGTITAGVIKHDTVGGSGGIWFSAATDTSSNVTVGNSGAIKNWRLLINNTFGVTSGGKLYATGADIKGSITATSFSALDSNSKERATVNTNGFIVKDASGNTVASLSNDLTLGQVVANRYNVFIDADTGIQNRKNTSVLSQFDSTSIKFYDGAGTAATNIISQFTSDGAVIGKTAGKHIVLDSNGMKVKSGQSTTIADFGSTITLGQTTSQAAVINSDGMQVYKDGVEVADFGTETAIYTSNGTELAHFGYRLGNSGNPESGTATAPYYTLGLRRDNSEIGNYSVAEGYDVTASGARTHVEGEACSALGHVSHAEGHACRTTENGMYAHAQNRSTVANGYCQTVIGTYNIPDEGESTHPIDHLSFTKYAFIIGNGDSYFDDEDNDVLVESNAYAVTWDGKRYANGYQIGEVISTNSNVNITSTNVDTYAQGASITLPAGTYLVIGTASFPSNATEAIRRIQLYNNTSGTGVRVNSYWGRYWVSHQVTFPLVTSQSTTMSVRVSAGVAISGVSTIINAIRIA